MSDFTIENLDGIEDSAAKFGQGEFGEVRFATRPLAAEDTGLAFHRVKPNKRQPFGHAHDAAEEVYVVIAGSGRVRLDDEIRDIKPLDAIRVAPKVVRAFEADGDGLEILAFGPRHEGDGELEHDFWKD